MNKDIEHLKYLDEILNYLLQYGYLSSAKVDEIFSYLEKNKISFDSKLEQSFVNRKGNQGSLNELDPTGFRKQAFDEAITYLQELNLIIVNNDTASLTYKGRIKTAYSFVAEHERDLDEKELRAQHMKDTRTVALIQKWTLPAAVVVAIIAIFAAYWKPTSTYYRYYNCCHKQDINRKVPEVDNSGSFHVEHEPNDSTNLVK